MEHEPGFVSAFMVVAAFAFLYGLLIGVWIPC
jgi:hypothetical protein